MNNAKLPFEIDTRLPLWSIVRAHGTQHTDRFLIHNGSFKIETNDPHNIPMAHMILCAPNVGTAKPTT